MKCKQCGAIQEVGFLLDIIHAGTAVLKPQGEQTVWARGTRTAIRGAPWYLALMSGLGFPINHAETLPVSAHRCTGCGLLEFYALPDPTET